MFEHIQIRKDVPSGTIMIDRPSCRNALTPKTISELQLAFQDFHNEKSVRGVVLTGVGDHFCSGTDLKHLHEQMQCPDPESFWQEEVPEFLALVEMILRFPKPVIASISGTVAGNGLALMLACDHIIATGSAVFSLPEVQLGLLPGLAAPLLVRRCGTGRANKMIMTGQAIDCKTAIEWNVVDEIVSEDLVWARCNQLAMELSMGSPVSHQMAKKLLNETISEEMFTQLSIGAANSAAIRSTEAARKGVEAFAEHKKKIDWVAEGF